MNKENRYNLFGQSLLLLATLLWGTSFLILKQTISVVPPIFVIGIRFLCSSVILGLIFFKRIKRVDKQTVKYGVILGIFLGFAYFTQTLGLSFTTPSKNAFLTSVYSIFCPFIIWIAFKKKPSVFNIVGAVLCVVGIGFIALSKPEGIGENETLGDILTLTGALFFSLQIIFIDKFNKLKDPMSLLIIELFTTSVMLLLYSLTYEGAVYGYDKFLIKGEMLYNVMFLTIGCTLFAQFLQMFGQKYAKPNQAAIVLTLEAVFGALFSIIMGYEKLNWMLGIGFIVVFISIIITESEPFIKRQDLVEISKRE